MTEINFHWFNIHIPVVLDFTNCLFTCGILPDDFGWFNKKILELKKKRPPAVFNVIA